MKDADELIKIEDPAAFRYMLSKAELSNKEIAVIIHLRSEYLANKYMPSEKEMEYVKTLVHSKRRM